MSFDDGQGQTGEDAKANGGISLFRHDDRMDVATGDATAAYGGALTEAHRTLVYLRERDLVLVLDRLRSDTPRRWEWNIHTPTAMVTYAENAIGTANGQAQLCVEQIAGTPTSTRVSDLFPVAPYRRGKLRPEQWHATFEAREPSTEGRFLFALRLNCAPSGISSAVIDESGRARIEIGQARLAIAFDGATLSRESARR